MSPLHLPTLKSNSDNLVAVVVFIDKCDNSVVIDLGKFWSAHVYLQLISEVVGKSSIISVFRVTELSTDRKFGVHLGQTVFSVYLLIHKLPEKPLTTLLPESPCEYESHKVP